MYGCCSREGLADLKNAVFDSPYPRDSHSLYVIYYYTERFIYGVFDFFESYGPV